MAANTPGVPPALVRHLSARGRSDYITKNGPMKYEIGEWRCGIPGTYLLVWFCLARADSMFSRLLVCADASDQTVASIRCMLLIRMPGPRQVPVMLENE